MDARLVAPPDKALSHRAALLLALSARGGRVRGFSRARDAESTLGVLKALGAGIRREGADLLFSGGGRKSLKAPAGDLDCGNSGSTMRMLAGVLAACPFEGRLVGDASLGRRPMARIADPLAAMGASVFLEDGHAPLRIRGGRLRGIDWTSPVASAQVKTAVLLAGLAAEGRTSFTEPVSSRDHTERMLGYLGVPVRTSGTTVSVEGGVSWEGGDLEIPGDSSSAAFFVVASCLREGWKVRVGQVGLNPTRLGFLRVLERMGARVSIRQDAVVCGEPVGELSAEGGSRLKGIRISAEEVPSLVDELPILALAATQAEGETVVSGASELRVKESDRIAALVAGLGAMGAKIQALPDGFRVEGPTPLKGAAVDSFGDHRIAMTLMVAGKLASGRTEVQGADSADVSYPGFAEALEKAVR